MPTFLRGKDNKQSCNYPYRTCGHESKKKVALVRTIHTVSVFFRIITYYAEYIEKILMDVV